MPDNFRAQVAEYAAAYARQKQIQERGAWGAAFVAESSQHAAECVRRSELNRLVADYNRAIAEASERALR